MCLVLFVSLPSSDAAVVEIKEPMPPPAWAQAQLALLKSNTKAAFVGPEKYMDERGWMRLTPNWGAADGPDDVMESYRHLPLLYILGGPPEILDLYKKISEGHLQQFTAAKEPLVEVAKDGMYYKEFCPSPRLGTHRRRDGALVLVWIGPSRRPSILDPSAALRRVLHERGPRGSQLRPEAQDHPEPFQR